MRFVTLFLKTENVHLIKDVGMIPYMLYKKYGYQSELVTWENGSYPYLEDKVKGLKLSFVKKTPFGRIYDGMHYLKYEASSIDILNIYHLNAASFFYERVFRKYNPMGKIFLKLDMNDKGFRDVFKRDLKGLIKRAIIRGADLATVENSGMKEALSESFEDRAEHKDGSLMKQLHIHSADHLIHGCRIAFIPNGFYREAEDTDDITADELHRKEQLILTVGNLGTPEKATDVLLEAFALSAEKHDYSLTLVGSIDPSFEPFINDFFKKHPGLKDRITFTGLMTDRKRLIGLYRRARYFALPSRSESFGFVLLEAAREGCYIIASDACSAALDITNKGRYGTIVKADDVSALAETFSFLYTSPPDSDQLRAEEIQFIEKNYSWDGIIEKLYAGLEELFLLREPAVSDIIQK
ncbi:MAG TPA: hypothetical protein DCL38_05780 [Lachnospiraceae bacterium]|nr:hypothetical protein [Lachnospiraceae bacterium]